jgi:hypothetical protein
MDETEPSQQPVNGTRVTCLLVHYRDRGRGYISPMNALVDFVSDDSLQKW